MGISLKIKGLTIALCVVGVLAPTATGCAFAAKPTAPPAPTNPAATIVPVTSTKPPKAAPTPVKLPKRGGVIKLRTKNDVYNLDPHMNTRGKVANSNLTYCALTRVTPKLEVLPYLAESWEVSPDGLTWTFRLRKGAKFHNIPPVNGREVTSEDVVYSLKRVGTKAPSFEFNYLVEPIINYETPDKYTVKLTTAKPFAPMLVYLSPQALAGIVPKEAVEKFGDLKKNVIGAGPMVFNAYEKDIIHSVRRNPDFFLKDLPYLDGVDELIIPDEATAVAAFRVGKLDVLGGPLITREGIPWDKVEAIKKTNPYVQVVEGWKTPIFMRFNVTKKPLSDVRVRRAMHLAFDRQEFLKLFFGGKGVLSALVPPSMGEWALPENELAKMPGFRQPKDADIAEAKRLLAEAGYPNGFTLGALQHPLYVAWTPLLQRQMAKIGIKVTPDHHPPTDYKKRQTAMNWDFQLHTTTMMSDPDNMIGDELFQLSGYRSPEVEALVEEQRQTLDEAKRLKLVYDIQRRLIEDLPWAPGVQPRAYAVLQPWVKDFREGVPEYHEAVLLDTWLDK